MFKASTVLVEAAKQRRTPAGLCLMALSCMVFLFVFLLRKAGDAPRHKTASVVLVVVVVVVVVVGGGRRGGGARAGAGAGAGPEAVAVVAVAVGVAAVVEVAAVVSSRSSSSSSSSRSSSRSGSTVAAVAVVVVVVVVVVAAVCSCRFFFGSRYLTHACGIIFLRVWSVANFCLLYLASILFLHKSFQNPNMEVWTLHFGFRIQVQDPGVWI